MLQEQELKTKIKQTEQEHKTSLPSKKQEWELDGLRNNLAMILENKTKPCNHTIYKEKGRIKCKKCGTVAISQLLD